MIGSLLFTSLTKALNYYLHQDNASYDRLLKLQGKIITIEWPSLHFIFQCQVTEEGVSLTEGEVLPASAKIIGSPWQMFNLMLSRAPAYTKAQALTIQGDIELAQQIMLLFKACEWDGEEYLSRLIGDVPSYHANRMVKTFKQWCLQAKDSLTNNLSEYLNEETNLVPPKEALQDFYHDIDQLRMDVDRLEARIKKIPILLNGENQ
jgi:ubiquinone biosynthesis accessory factor UbiJ